MAIQAAVRQLEFFKKWPYKPAIGTDSVDLKRLVSFSTSSTYSDTKKMLSHGHGAEIPPKYPKSRYANRDFPIQGDGARHNK